MVRLSKTATEPVQVCLPIPQGVSSSQAYIFRYNEDTETWSRQTAGRDITDGFVCVDVSQFSLFTVGSYPRSPPTPPDPGGGGGGGGGSRDQHGNTPAQATPVSLGAVAPWMASTAGEINTAADIDYFQITVPQAGVVVVETTGRTDTMGTAWQDGEQLATADSGGERQNFLLSARVEAGLVMVAVEGRRTGAYSLETTLLVGVLENPSDFGLPLSIPITTNADTLAPEFATFNAETAPCGTVVNLDQFPARPTLREALIYANALSVQEPITITFALAPGLDNQTIILTDSLPSLCGGDLTLDGDVYALGSNTTLNGAGVPAALEVLTIRSANNTIKNFKITNVPEAGILVWHTESFGETVTGNEVLDNTITGGQYGIVVQAGSATEAGMLSKTTVSGNTISETTNAGIGVFAMYAGSKITDTVVEMNKVFENSGSGITASSSAVNTTLADSITKLKIQDKHGLGP